MKLSGAQRSAMHRLQLNNGYSPLSNAMYRTFCALADRGLVVITVENPVKGHVTMTDYGKKLYPLPVHD